MITVKPANKLKAPFALIVVMLMSGVALPDTFTVINTRDGGSGSLRRAIIEANAHTGPDRIEFDIDGDGPHIIQPLSILPDIVDSAVIDGYTQDGASPATTATSAILKVMLDGSATPNATALFIAGGVHDCSIRGLKIRQYRLAIGLAGHGNYVEGNHILDGVYEGIGIMGEHNTVGGVAAEQRNVVTGNNVAIWISPSSAHNHIQGNYIGTDVDGQFDASTGGMEGVAIGASDNTVADNVISGYEQGITILRWAGTDPLPENNVIEGNKIGTNADGTLSIPNELGIRIYTCVNNIIKGNLITKNTFGGVVVQNDFPDNSEGDSAVGNRITQNAIHDNGGLGIDLALDGVTVNDEGDIDAGPNNLMNFPVLRSAIATPGQLIVTGTIDTPDLMSVTLEFFANSVPDDSGYGEGEIYLGAAKPNATGAFTAAVSPVSPGMWISATATDGDRNTSEFALCIPATEVGKP